MVREWRNFLMARGTIDLDAKIEKQKEVVAKKKEQYEKAVADLESLKKKKDEESREKLIQAIEASGKSYDEILAFLKE
jgi:Xaa-Pro aminopeptidase